MSAMLKLYFHPLASFCHKALIALYENDTPFEAVVVDLGDTASREAFLAVWPTGKMPVLRDDGRGRTVAESTIVVEYLDSFYPGAARLVPDEPDQAWEARMWDRFFDHYLHEQMQKVVLDTLRPEAQRDTFGVAQARAQIDATYRIVETRMAGRTWALGDAFTLADCAAAPALFYADLIEPLSGAARAYLDRLMARPSYARTLREAAPYFAMFPLARKPRLPGATP